MTRPESANHADRAWLAFVEAINLLIAEGHDAAAYYLLAKRKSRLKQWVKYMSGILKSHLVPDDPKAPIPEALEAIDGVRIVAKPVTKIEYGPAAIQWLAERELLAPFAAVSTEKLKTLAKDGVLSADELDELKALGDPETNFQLRMVYPEGQG